MHQEKAFNMYIINWP